MFKNDKIVIKDIIFVNHIFNNKNTSNEKYNTSNANHYQLLYKLSGDAIITFDGKTIREKGDNIRFTPNPSDFDYDPLYEANIIEYGDSINIGFTSESSLPK